MSDQREAFEERSAIIQFSSGRPSMTREEAEKEAAKQMDLTDEEFQILKGEKRECRSEDEDEFMMGTKSDAEG